MPKLNCDKYKKSFIRKIGRMVLFDCWIGYKANINHQITGELIMSQKVLRIRMIHSINLKGHRQGARRSVQRTG